MRRNRTPGNKREEELPPASSDSEEEDEEALQAALRDIVSIPDVDAGDFKNERRVETERTWSEELKQGRKKERQKPAQRQEKKEKKPQHGPEMGETSDKTMEGRDLPKTWSAEFKESMKSWYADLRESQKPKRSHSQTRKRSRHSSEVEMEETAVLRGKSPERESKKKESTKKPPTKELEAERTSAKKVKPKMVSFVEPDSLIKLETESDGLDEPIDEEPEPSTSMGPSPYARPQSHDSVEANPLAVPSIESGMGLINLLAVPFQRPLGYGSPISASKVVDKAGAGEEKAPASPEIPSVGPRNVTPKAKPASDAEEERDGKESQVESKTSLAHAESMKTLTITGHRHITTQWRDHCHLEVQPEGIDKPARRKLIVACVLCLSFMILEVIGGVLSNSLAIATDAAHLLTDLAGFLISLFALYISARPNTQRMNFGWYRAEVIGAMISVYFIWVITGILVWLAIQRLWVGEHNVDPKIMLITSAVAILFNVIMAFQLHHGHGHGHFEPGEVVRQTRILHEELPKKELQLVESSVSVVHVQPPKENINVRAAMIHVIGDMIQSVGVFVAALIIFFRPEWSFVDAICTFLFSIIVVLVTIRILRDVLMVLMEATPDYMDYDEVQRAFLSIEGVEHVHNLRIWALSINKVALSAHLAIKKDADPQSILEEATKMIHKRYRFFETTIQIEEYTPGMENCEQCIKPGMRLSRGDSRTIQAMEEGAHEEATQKAVGQS
ncbi:uncharacterized protein LOC113565754 [Drosophila persimilis]|uniref:uncharacterized protein LOC113565754 n=1 Tax=Drosophila persimilis TaxID=7234 RepID=UPI000F085621|nr:uncharacterized protein LOC113565754 [Drosophila persimilis]